MKSNTILDDFDSWKSASLDEINAALVVRRGGTVRSGAPSLFGVPDRIHPFMFRLPPLPPLQAPQGLEAN